VSWRVVFTRHAQKDAKKLARCSLRKNAQALLDLLAADPNRTASRFEKLVGDLAGTYSRRINLQHRLVYQVLDAQRIVKGLRMWTHREWALRVPGAWRGTCPVPGTSGVKYGVPGTFRNSRGTHAELLGTPAH